MVGPGTGHSFGGRKQLFVAFWQRVQGSAAVQLELVGQLGRVAADEEQLREGREAGVLVRPRKVQLGGEPAAILDHVMTWHVDMIEAVRRSVRPYSR